MSFGCYCWREDSESEKGLAPRSFSQIRPEMGITQFILGRYTFLVINIVSSFPLIFNT